MTHSSEKIEKIIELFKELPRIYHDDVINALAQICRFEWLYDGGIQELRDEIDDLKQKLEECEDS
jgi:hypothetical protein